MEAGMCVQVALAGLYLRGLGGAHACPRRHWHSVEALLRRCCPAEASCEVVTDILRNAGYAFEAQALRYPGLWDSAHALLESGRVLTHACSTYPQHWRYALGGAAPPALWVSGSLPPGNPVSVVGSRSLPPWHARFALQAGKAIADSGMVIVSGGAQGADRMAASQGSAIEVWPCGVEWGRNCGWGSEHAVVLSVAAPGESFSAALAMERNLLVYAMSPVTLVAHARLRKGGSWNGAVEAIRRRIGVLCVPQSPDSNSLEPGLSALIALGAIPIGTPEELLDVSASRGLGWDTGANGQLFAS